MDVAGLGEAAKEHLIKTREDQATVREQTLNLVGRIDSPLMSAMPDAEPRAN